MAFTGNFMCTSFKQEILQAVHNFTNTTGDTFKLALYDNSASFTAATTAFGALIYNDTAAGDPTVCVLDFGGAKTSTSGTFTIVFPTADATNAIIRIA
jgi:hypothetical protein